MSDKVHLTKAVDWEVWNTNVYHFCPFSAFIITFTNSYVKIKDKC